ncbi:winged helix-turn-helix domain-containing protein [Micromonospora profundi]|uniref:winged helix-turn-helix domain-containing protein n=1 Tax=Micromonospora profundi TaxID=1420889 RepID=UPI0036781F43
MSHVERVSAAALGDLGVVIVRWPTELRRREECRLRGVPRLLVVEAGVPAPPCPDALEDWVRLPVEREDARVRVRTLLVRAALAGRPVVTRQNLLRVGDRQTPLSPLEAVIMRRLVASYGDVVDRDELTDLCWPDCDAAPNGLYLQILRLRRRIKPLQLVIHTVWGRGYVLEAGENTA